MPAQYKRDRARQEKISRWIGISAAVGAHLLLFVFGFSAGMKYLYPPPAEESLLLDFSADYEPEIPEQVRRGTEPRALDANPEEEIKLIQQSQGQFEGTKLNEAPESTVDDFGDVDVAEPERKKEIDRRALFPAADNKTDKDTLAAQTAQKVTDALKAGHASGNTLVGETRGEPNARVEGRTVLGTLPKPSYQVQATGIVVVEIWVDQNGTVTRAYPGADGTTLTDKTLWAAAEAAAKKTHFNVKADTPVQQRGTITYIFNYD